MAQTKLDLSDNKFEQLPSEALHLSGCTYVFGQLQLKSGSTLSILPNVGEGKVLTSDGLGTATWQINPGGGGITNASNGLTRIGTTDVVLGGPLTGNTCISTNNGNLWITGCTNTFGIYLDSNSQLVSLGDYTNPIVPLNYLIIQPSTTESYQSDGSNSYTDISQTSTCLQSFLYNCITCDYVESVQASNYACILSLCGVNGCSFQINICPTEINLGDYCTIAQHYIFTNSGCTTMHHYDYNTARYSNLCMTGGSVCLSSYNPNVGIPFTFTLSPTGASICDTGNNYHYLCHNIDNTHIYHYSNVGDSIDISIAPTDVNLWQYINNGNQNCIRLQDTGMQITSIVGGINSTLGMSGNTMIITGAGAFEGVKYANNYNSYFVERSLVDKFYVDNLITGNTTAITGGTNGLKIDGTNCRNLALGGCLCCATTIDIKCNTFLICGAVGVSFIEITEPSGGDSCIALDSCTLTSVCGKCCVDIHAGTNLTIGFNGTGIITDSTGTPLGLQYALDTYRNNFTNCSLVDKGYVDKRVCCYTSGITITSSADEIIFNDGVSLVGNNNLKYCCTIDALQVGASSIATGSTSVAIGGGMAYGIQSVAMMAGTTWGQASLAMAGATACGFESFAFGGGSCVVCDGGIVIGGTNILCSQYAGIIVGNGNTICSGNTYSVLLGGTGIIIEANCFLNTVIVPSLAIFNTPAGSGDYLCWNSNTKMVELAIGSTGSTSTANGQSITKLICQPSHGFIVGDVVGWSGGTYNKAIADGLYNGEVLGLVSKCYNTDCFDLVQAGYVTGLTSLSANTTYFLSTATPGLLTDINPTGNTLISKAVIIATSESTGWVLPYPGYIVTTGSTSGGISLASNGLTTDGTTVCLGGTLIQNTIFDGGASCYNLRYAGDYSANYTDRSLVDAAYVTGKTNASMPLIAQINVVSGTTYTIQSTDLGKNIEFTNAGAVTITLPTGFTVGFQVVLVNIGGSDKCMTAGAGATLYTLGSKIKISGAYNAATVYYRDVNKWVGFGNLS